TCALPISCPPLWGSSYATSIAGDARAGTVEYLLPQLLRRPAPRPTKDPPPCRLPTFPPTAPPIRLWISPAPFRTAAPVTSPRCPPAPVSTHVRCASGGTCCSPTARSSRSSARNSTSRRV